MRTLVWFRGKDLRVGDHAPLQSAVRAGEVVPVFVLDPYFFAPERARRMPNRVAFLLESLSELQQRIAELGSRLLVVEGKSVAVVPELARRLEVDRVVAYRWSEPVGIERDRRVAEALAVPLELFEGETLATPAQVRTRAGAPFSVFTPFSRAFLETVTVEKPISAPRALPPLPKLEKIVETKVPTPEALGLQTSPHRIEAGEKAALARLARFVRGPAARYEEGRNALGEEGTSRLSQDLKFGTVSARKVWTAVKAGVTDKSAKSARIYLNELLWREFAYDVLRERPDVMVEPFKAAWRGFPWRKDAKGWRAWVDGTTGYPVVDAAARQLLEEGFVHNRARMISASFLTKHLLVDFRDGEAHYMQWLTDGDWAANDLGWQWTAGCGVDASPWFRIFNPVAQGQRFDPDGAYVKKYVPELAALPVKWIHAPWEAPKNVLAGANVRLGKDYPEPIVDHAFGRKRFLAAAEGHLATKQGGG